MSTITKSITSMSSWGGYDQGGNYYVGYIFFSNGIVVPNETITAVSGSLEFTPYDSSSNELSSLETTTQTVQYFSTATGNGYTLGNDQDYGSNLLSINKLIGSTYKGQTIYIGGVFKTIDDKYEAADDGYATCTLSGTVTFTTASATYTYTINTVPSGAVKYIAGSSRSSYTAAAGTSFSWICCAEGYNSQTKTITMPSANTTITVYLRTIDGGFKLGSSNPSAIKIGSSDSPRVYLGSNLIWYKNSLGTTEIAPTTITVTVATTTAGATSTSGQTNYTGSNTVNVGKGAANITVLSATGITGATVTASPSYNTTTGVLTVNTTSTVSGKVTVKISLTKGI